LPPLIAPLLISFPILFEFETPTPPAPPAANVVTVIAPPSLSIGPVTGPV
jgi:hypothetical protein